MNSTQARITQESEMIREEFKAEFKKYDISQRSQLEEIGQLLHNVHSDHENFSKKQVQESTESNMKIVKMQEVAHKCLDSLEDNNQGAAKTATLVTCMLEFCNMTQALYV